jgi:hypothetical protein
MPFEKLEENVKVTWEPCYRLAHAAMQKGKPPVGTRLDLKGEGDSGAHEARLASPNIMFGAKVKIQNPNKVPIQVGFTQTCYYSRRNWYYNSPNKTVQSDQVDAPPVWDGQREDVAPWYEPPEDVNGDFDDEVYFNDSPGCQSYAEDPHLSHFAVASVFDPMDLILHRPSLFFIDGEDSFQWFLAVSIKAKIHTLDQISWYVKYAAEVDPDAYAVTPLMGSGAYLNVKGRDWGNKAKLDGPGSEEATTVTRTTWNKASLPLQAKAVLEERLVI